MTKDLMCSLLAIERFLLDHRADESVTNAFKEVKRAIYEQKINRGELESAWNPSQTSNKASKSNGKSLATNFFHTLFCSCVHRDTAYEEDTLAPTYTENVIKEDDASQELVQSPRPRKGWVIGDSRRNVKINYDSQEEYEKVLSQLGNNWNVDILALSNFKTVTQMGPIVCVGHALISPVGDRIHPEFNKLLSPVLTMIQDVYLPNPYHNALHGACVAHMTAVLTKALGLKECLTPIEEFAYLIAAIGHDAGHPGKTNAFLRSTESPLALIYNDASILENYHASLVCHIIRSQETFFDLFSQTDWELIRKRIIQLVLATDMMSHFTHINNVRDRRVSGAFDYKNNPEDLWLLMVLCVKTADIGHNFLPWCEHLPWTKSLFDEFHMQGDEERLLSIPLLLFFDRTRSADIPDSQLGFFQGFTTPLINELIFIDSNSYLTRFLQKNSQDNLDHWKKNSKRELADILSDLDKSTEIHEIADASI
ncbi:3'5'-cyclic nucleotide phosphodiesterase, putative [Babesia bigemina]|uniref:3'5'-cyclic nucleotide phosphodiesterase, putative n=1 Tax=Babesia bigemina TaxID=5866 RepID=A0A061D6B2_BABBI|nr:3'5'-cyclic nucleotide phosphodiesterase, putative [Babesia bigemina]CDR94469.1 3'5'-cyclic nucleotide phosphodiesterase, putative [Babesia bigemina]|eukprot:XP_012766655.1 3'5'-cyclic nucleotide phosphodiesterase, putative [Babesia bigemina]